MKWLLKIFTGGLLDRVLDTVDRKVASETDREAIKGEIIREHYRTRADVMRAGGFWLTLMLFIPVWFHFSAVVFYSVFFCQGCAYPQPWTIAALPAPFDEWEGMIIVSIIGLIGVSRLGGRK